MPDEQPYTVSDLISYDQVQPGTANLCRAVAMIASRPFGTMFQVTGTAATQ